MLVRIIFNQRKKGAVYTDARVRLTTEVLGGIRLIKRYAWEVSGDRTCACAPCQERKL